MRRFELKMTDNLKIKGLICEPKKAKGIFLIVHGMCEYKERYNDLLKFLSSNGYVTAIYDQRGHGESIRNNDELGYFGKNKNILIDELDCVINYLKKEYNGLSLILFGHSMGSLVARGYLQKFDTKIDKLILCGTPTYNPLSKIAVILANIVCKVKGDKNRSKLLNNLSVGSYNKGFSIENEWLSYNEDNINKYNEDKLCGFTFTNNGFRMLFNLLDNVFKKRAYEVKNNMLPILMVGGYDDPVIGGKSKFDELYNFLKKVGYVNITKKLYPKMRHEILNEKNNDKVYDDILKFVNK